MSHSSAPRSLLLAGAFFSAFTLSAAAQQPAASASRRAAPAAAPRFRRARPDRASRGQRSRRQARAGGAAADCRPRRTSCRRRSSRCRPASTSRSTPRAWRTRARSRWATRARCSSAAASSTRSMPSSTRTASATVKVLASGLYRPNGVAFKDGTLYIAELSKVSKIDKVEDILDNPPKPTVIYDKLPKDEAHGWKFIGIGPDNKLYVPVGQPGNNVLHDDDHGQIRRMNLDGSGAEVIARGRPQHRRLRLASRDQAALLHRQRPRLDVGRRARGRTQPRHQGRRAFRRAVLPAGQYRRSRIRLGQILQRIHRAGRPAGSAFRSARHAVLHRQHVPEGLQERDHHRPARLVEPVEEGRR